MGASANFAVLGGAIDGAQAGLAIFEGNAMASGYIDETRRAMVLGGRMLFHGNAVAGGSICLNNDGAMHLGVGAEAVTQFLDDSVLSGTVQNFAGNGTGFAGGRLEFRDRSRFDATPIAPNWAAS